MKVLVTGGAGFIGSHLVDALVKKGHQAMILDDFSAGSKKFVNTKARAVVVDIRGLLSPRRFFIWRLRPISARAGKGHGRTTRLILAAP
jgi:UDP-glucose 4-epimerase